MHILNQIQVNLIYNTNCNLFTGIEIFISTTDLYNTTADRWLCHLPNRNKMRRSVCNARASNGVGPFTFKYQGNGSTPCQYIDTTRKAIDCTTSLPLTVFIWWNFAADFSSFIVEIARKMTNLGIWSPFWGSRGGVEPWLMARWKAHVDFLLTVIELLFLSLSIEVLQGKTCQKALLFGGGGSVWAKISGGRGRPSGIFFGF